MEMCLRVLDTVDERTQVPVTARSQPYSADTAAECLEEQQQRKTQQPCITITLINTNDSFICSFIW